MKPKFILLRGISSSHLVNINEIAQISMYDTNVQYIYITFKGNGTNLQVLGNIDTFKALGMKKSRLSRKVK